MSTATDDMAVREAEIVEEFSIFEDPMDRYAYLIDVGKKLPALPAALQRDEFLVPGCQSKVWLIPEHKAGRVWFQADSNTAITRGIIALLLRVLSGQPAAAIQSAGLGFLDAISLRAHLSSQRANGLASMINRIKTMAGAADEAASSSAADTAFGPPPKQAS
jgi:cysteine desulfuration protein SufE